MNPQPQLPKELIDRIFAEMACQYGRRFAEMWAGIDHDTVRAFWARKLGGFAEYPQVIMAALDALDDRPLPPTLPEFSALCRNALRRIPAGPALPPPPIDIAAAKARLAEAKRSIGGRR